jgi:hypothetical protein
MIKNFLKIMLPQFLIEKMMKIIKQVHNFRALSVEYGQWSTIKDWNSVDESGYPTPWYTYPATEYLSHLDFTKMTIFEYGSGNSTLWWSQRAENILSVEDDENWFEKIKNPLQKKGTQYLLKTNKLEYIEAAYNSNDVFIIDGQFRRECAEHVAKVGGAAAMIILDNSDWYPSTVEFLRNSLNWVQVDFHGFGPINNYTWTTSIFINPIRHHELVYIKKLRSKCGLVQVANGDY